MKLFRDAICPAPWFDLVLGQISSNLNGRAALGCTLGQACGQCSRKGRQCGGEKAMGYWALLANPLPLPNGKQLGEAPTAPPRMPQAPRHPSAAPGRQSSAAPPVSPAQQHLPSSPGFPAWSPPAGCGMCKAAHGFLHAPDTAWLLDSYKGLISIPLSCQPWVTSVSCDSGLCQCVLESNRMSNFFAEMRISDVHLMPRCVALTYGMTAQPLFFSLLHISSSDAYKGATDNCLQTVIQSLSFAVTAKSDSWFRGVTFQRHLLGPPLLGAPASPHTLNTAVVFTASLQPVVADCIPPHG